MKLGIIASVSEECFQYAAEQGLDFLEFCINGDYNTNWFFGQLPQIQSWMSSYKIQIGSIGRWKTYVLDENGQIDQDELELAYRLINAASTLGCANYVCGCNYVDHLSYYENCTRAIELLGQLVAYDKTRGVDISTYNCRKTNFIHNPMAWKIIHGYLPELGIKFDPSHSRYNGGDYLKETQEWGNRFYHVHLKGSLLVDGKRVDDPPAGMDQTDWKTFLAILYAKHYDRGLSLEPHSATWEGDLGEKGLNYSIGYIKSLLFR